MSQPTRVHHRKAEAAANDRALLDAARAVVAVDGAHASVAAIAAQAGVGIGSLYRRYPTKEALFQELIKTGLDRWLLTRAAPTPRARPSHPHPCRKRARSIRTGQRR